MLSKKRVNKNPQQLLFSGVYDRNQSIKALNLTPYIEKILIDSKITTVGKFYKIKKRKLLKLRGVGPKTARHIMSIKKNINLLKYLDSEQGRNVETNIPVSRKDPIEVLGLPIRIENALRKSRIRSVIEFYNYPEKKITKIKNMGPKTKKFLLTVIKPKIIFTDLKQSSRGEFKQSINDVTTSEILLEMLFKKVKNVRDAEVMHRRYGLFTGERETLEEIGKTYGITRERVRQIQSRALKRLQHPSNRFKGPVSDIVNNLIVKKSGVISDIEADELIPELFGEKKFDGSSFLDLLADCGWIQAQMLAEGDVSFYSPKIKGFDLNKVNEKIYATFKNTKELIIPQKLIKLIPKKIEQLGVKRIEFVTKLCRVDPRIDERTKNKFTLYSNHSTVHIWVNLMSEVLKDKGIPMHFTEIADGVNDLLISGERKLDHRRAHSILIEQQIFAHTGRNGTYGLIKWGLRKESTIDLAREYIKKAGFPVHWRQIYNYVGRYKDSPKENIISILEFSGKFDKKGKGFYDIR